MKNLHMIEVKYLGATNTRGSRVKLTSHRFDSRVTIPYNHAFNNAHDIALHWLHTNGFQAVFSGEWKNGQSIVAVKNFRPLERVQDALERIRQEIRAERVSYAEIADLQELADYIDSGDAELLEWAGVKEQV